MKPRSTSWVLFTKRTEDPKLAWLEKQLAAAGIKSRRNGESFHAPVLEVKQRDLDAAWKILAPVDDIRDDHPRFAPVTVVKGKWDSHGQFKEVK